MDGGACVLAQPLLGFLVYLVVPLRAETVLALGDEGQRGVQRIDSALPDRDVIVMQRRPVSMC